MPRAFRQVDVYSSDPYRGNPVAVVLDGEGIDDEAMQRFAHWQNLSETAFLLPATDPAADYRVRIFTPTAELPFAGHPTLGSCHAWLEAGGAPRDGGAIVQECGAGLVTVRRDDGRLAFAAPPLVRDGPVEPELLERVAAALGLAREDIVDARWAQNGPAWIAVLLESADAVLAVERRFETLDIGLVGPHPPGSPEAFEVRAFFARDGAYIEDPVTGSLNAGLASWLLKSGRATAPYVAAQGTALGRTGRVHVSLDGDGRIWIGGATATRATGEAVL